MKTELPLLSEGKQLRDSLWQPSATSIIHPSESRDTHPPCPQVSPEKSPSTLLTGEWNGGEVGRQEGHFVSVDAVYSFRASMYYF